MKLKDSPSCIPPVTNLLKINYNIKSQKNHIAPHTKDDVI